MDEQNPSQASRAEILSVDVVVSENYYTLEYQIDERFLGHLRIRYPFSLTTISSPVITLVGLWQTVFLSGLCLPERIVLKFPVYHGMIDDIQPVIRSLYDVRCFRENIPIIDQAPAFELVQIISNDDDFQTFSANKRATLVWSGGKDSTLAYTLLKKNNYEVVPLYLPVNLYTKEYERKAVQDIASFLGVESLEVELDFPEFFDIANYYSTVFAKPDTHPIPHGRDLLLFSPALIVSEMNNTAYICAGIEKDAWIEKVNYRGYRIRTYDVGSEAVVSQLNSMLEKYIETPRRIFSPVAPFSDYYVFKIFFEQMPELAKYITSCHYSYWCGKCSKCTRYDLYQKSLGLNAISFATENSPVEARNYHLEHLVNHWQDRRVLDWGATHYALLKLVEKNPQLDGIFAQYRQSVYPQLIEDVHEMEDLIFSRYPAFLPEEWISSIEDM